jgi:uncharacterized lipoprotein YajG
MEVFMKSLLILIGVGILVLLSGCGIAIVDLQYTPTGTHQLVTTASPKVVLQIQDSREKKVFFRTALGENDDEGKSGMLRLRRSPSNIFQEGFTNALQTAGYQVFPDGPVVFNVQIKRFLAVDRENNTDTIKSDIALDVSVVHQRNVLARKSIFETKTEKSSIFKAWQNSVPPILNDSLSRAIEKAVWDPDILLAIERANNLDTTRDDILSRLRIPPRSFTATVPHPSPKLPPVTIPKSSTPPVSTRSSYQLSTQPTRSSTSPFQAQHVRGLGQPEVHILNQSGKTINITLTGPESETFSVSPHDTVTKKIKAGSYSYHASAIGVTPASGKETFNTDYRYTWTFWITSLPSIRLP